LGRFWAAMLPDPVDPVEIGKVALHGQRGLGGQEHLGGTHYIGSDHLDRHSGVGAAIVVGQDQHACRTVQPHRSPDHPQHEIAIAFALGRGQGFRRPGDLHVIENCDAAPFEKLSDRHVEPCANGPVGSARRASIVRTPDPATDAYLDRS